MDSQTAALGIQEVVEAEGHLIDWHLMEQIFDKLMDKLLAQLLGLGCAPVDSGDARLGTVEDVRKFMFRALVCAFLIAAIVYIQCKFWS